MILGLGFEILVEFEKISKLFLSLLILTAKIDTGSY
jgi:hypothetical protein